MSGLLILLMHLVHEAQFLNVTPLSLSFSCLAAASSLCPVMVFVPLTSMYESAQSHKLDFSIEVLIWILLLVYVPLDSSFISTYFFVLNLNGWFDALSKKCAIFDIPLLYCYTNHNSSIIYCLSSGDIYLFFGLSTSVSPFDNSFADFFELNRQFLLLFFELLFLK